MHYRHTTKGFTLVEIMVSVTIFSLVMVIVMGAIFSVFEANTKSKTLQTVMDNLNFTVESMTRTIRFGTNYHCDVGTGNFNSPADCMGGANSIALVDSSGATVFYALRNGRISRSKDLGQTYYDLTGSDVTINKLTFWVLGSQPFSNGDVLQPKVIIVIEGEVGLVARSKTKFTIETTVSQRMFDSQ